MENHLKYSIVCKYFPDRSVMLIIEIQKIVQKMQRENLPAGVIKNHIKEYLQFYVLDFIYNSPFNKKFIFTGGTCLRICYGLNRLSEDIDFDIIGSVDMEAFANDVYAHFVKKLQHKDVEFSIKGKNDKIYLKFPILKSLGLADAGASDKLYIKIETTPVTIKNYGLEITPVDRERLNFLVQHYDLPTLMACKINAIFQRVYFKGKNNEISFKGRDVYDLIWYLEKGAHPNMSVIKGTLGIASEKALFEKIYKKVGNYRSDHLLKDLENLFDNQVFIKNWAENFKTILAGRLF